MEHRRAFVTGASSGLGEAIALGLARARVEVVLAARREPELERVASAISEAGGTAHVCSLDVRNGPGVIETLRRLDDELGGIDLVIANAGVSGGRWGGKLDWKRHVEPVLSVNVIGATATLVALLPRMVERGRGHVVGISSLAQYRGISCAAPYSGSKAYLSHFLESLRIDVSDVGIAVTDVRPGWVDTDMAAGSRSRKTFMVPVAHAAEIIVSGIIGHREVIEFPLVSALGMRIASRLPAYLYARVARRPRR